MSSIKLKWIGLTGGIGTGKTTVSEMIQSLGYTVINADQIAHKALLKNSPVFNYIVTTFGQEILNANGDVDRQKLSKIVFSDRHKLAKLESVVHPYVQEEVLRIKKKLEDKGVEMAFYDVPLLFEKKMEKKFDRIVLVSCKKDFQIQRAVKRSSLSEEEVKKRIAIQIPLESKMKASHHVIQNNGTLDELRMKVQDLVLALKKSLKLV